MVKSLEEVVQICLSPIFTKGSYYLACTPSIICKILSNIYGSYHKVLWWVLLSLTWWLGKLHPHRTVGWLQDPSSSHAYQPTVWWQWQDASPSDPVARDKVTSKACGRADAWGIAWSKPECSRRSAIKTHFIAHSLPWTTPNLFSINSHDLIQVDSLTFQDGSPYQLLESAQKSFMTHMSGVPCKCLVWVGAGGRAPRGREEQDPEA